MNSRIAISSGDFNGIGPEIIIKTLQQQKLAKVTPIVLSTSQVFDFYLERLNQRMSYHYAKSADDIKDHQINILKSYGNEDLVVHPGVFTKQSGRCAMLAVEKGIDLCKSQIAAALVTAPISKEAVNLAGYAIPGHTEFLAQNTDTTNYMMMLVNDSLRVGLVTIHIPLAKVRDHVSEASVSKNIRIMHQSLQKDFNIEEPRIAVLGLNPHAGDGGVIGNEEMNIITPALQNVQNNNIHADGPFPADSFFGNKKYVDYDGILAMYHDQGLIPFKTLSFGKGVNFTAGLPIIRTSPDHGTAFDIAGKNVADPSSFQQAFNLAITFAKNRKEEAVS